MIKFRKNSDIGNRRIGERDGIRMILMKELIKVDDW